MESESTMMNAERMRLCNCASKLPPPRAAVTMVVHHGRERGRGHGEREDRRVERP